MATVKKSKARKTVKAVKKAVPGVQEVKAKQYPVQLSVDYPARLLNRWSTFFRVFMLIPIAVILALIVNCGEQSAAVGFIILPTLLMIVFREKYPKWWYEWNYNVVHFLYRVAAYAALLTDEYPATDQEQYIHIRLPYPDAKKELNRWMPLIKWLLAVPHYIVLAVLTAVAVIVAVIIWFAILFTGRIPRSLFDFMVDVLRWHLRVMGYAVLMITDQYPPFKLGA